MNLLSLLSVGFLLGMRHATDADHVVAVSAIVAREKRLGPACLLGAVWGLGHTATVFGVGAAIVLLKTAIPARVGLSLELAVGVMLVLLGAANLAGRRLDHASEGPSRFPFQRALAVGLVHGLAGSAAVALLVLATVPEPRQALAYLLIFGLGTLIGMLTLSALMESSMLYFVRRGAVFARALTAGTGSLSLAFGLWIVYRIGFVDGLFLSAPVWVPR